MFSLTEENQKQKEQIMMGTQTLNMLKLKVESLTTSNKVLTHDLDEVQEQCARLEDEKSQMEHEMGDLQDRYMEAVRLAMSQEEHIKIDDAHMTPELQKSRSQLKVTFRGDSEHESDD